MALLRWSTVAVGDVLGEARENRTRTLLGQSWVFRGGLGGRLVVLCLRYDRPS